MVLLRIDAPIVSSLLIILGISVLLILLLKRFKLPSVIGFLIAGGICGTNGVNLHEYIILLPEVLSAPLLEFMPIHIAPPEKEVEILAEIGVILLLFTIGLEFSISSIVRLKKAVLIGGSLQVVLTIVLFTLITYFSSYNNWPIAIFIGFLFALSSTAIVLKLLQESGDINKSYGQIILAILIFQDVAVVPMMLVLPMLASGDIASLPWEISVLLFKLVILIAFVYLLAKYIMPYVLFQIVKARSKDLFVVSVVAICFVIAFITDLIGLSLALGAFLAGLIISESRYSHQVVGAVIYFKELFTSIFFISVGLMLDLIFLKLNWHIIIGFTLLVIFLKALIGVGVAFILNKNPKTILGVAIGIAQVGEFSFILSKVGEEVGIMPIEIYQYFLAVAIFTMILSPILIYYLDSILDWFSTSKVLPQFLRKYVGAVPTTPTVFNVNSDRLEDHLVIVGNNLTTHTLAHGARTMSIPYVIIEQDPELVAIERKRGEPIIYGDASNEEVLRHAHIQSCNLVVIATTHISDVNLCLEAIKYVNPEAFVITRTHTTLEAEVLRVHGADVTVADEVQSNMEILVHVLDHLNLPTRQAFDFAEYIREESIHETIDSTNQDMLHSKSFLTRWLDWVTKWY